jgi:alpha-tubulin suppressor-like RCC1 family protein
VSVSGLTGATQIESGYDHTCASVSGGTVSCWGLNDHGQLGNGTTTNSSIPVSVSGVTAAVQVSAGGSHTCALVTGGSGVKCWGANSEGQLGNNSTADSSTPVDVVAMTALSVKAPSSVPKGTKAKITGKLSSGNPVCVPSQQVTLKEGSSTAGTATTGAAGGYTFTLKITKKTAVQVIYPGNLSCGPSKSAKKTITVT